MTTIHVPNPSICWLLLLGVAGCVTGSRQIKDRQKAMQEVVLEPTVIQGAPDEELGLSEFDAGTLLKEGLRFQAATQFEKALLFYQRLLKDFSTSRYVSAAAFNAGRCLEELNRPAEAVEKYRSILNGLPESKDWVDAAFRESMCLAGLEKHPEAIKTLDRLLARTDLTISDRIDAMVLRGEALTNTGETLDGERQFRAALRLHRDRERQEYLDPAPAARAEFRLADLAGTRFRAAPLRPPESQMENDLEDKAALLLEAQAGYLRCMRFGDPEWATAAGYRIGTLYLDLYQAMEQSPAPNDLTKEEIDVYRDLLRQRLAVLLRKALKVFEMTLSLAERTRSDNQWTRAAREEMARVEAQVMSQLEPLPPESKPASQP